MAARRVRQNVVWHRNGVALASGTFTTPAALADVRWKMAGTHDFADWKIVGPR